jgi:hypothetical protein
LAGLRQRRSTQLNFWVVDAFWSDNSNYRTPLTHKRTFKRHSGPYPDHRQPASQRPFKTNFHLEGVTILLQSVKSSTVFYNSFYFTDPLLQENPQRRVGESIDSPPIVNGFLKKKQSIFNGMGTA